MKRDSIVAQTTYATLCLLHRPASVAEQASVNLTLARRGASAKASSVFGPGFEA